MAIFEELKNPEFQEKLRECGSPEEVLELAQEEGIALDDAELEGISGGWGDNINDRNDPTRHL